MDFSKPSIFYYLFLLIIPVLIHLFNFKKHKTIYFSSIYFLKDVIQKNKSKYEIKRWIILLNRLSIITMIILAFTLPYVENNIQNSMNIGIYIDNSFSMDRADFQNSRLITHAKNNAKKIIHQLHDNQKILILTNNHEKRYQSWCSQEEAIKLIDEIEITGEDVSINKILQQYHHTLSDTSKINTCYLFSDFQKKKNILPHIEFKNTHLYIGQLNSNYYDNISIDSCYFETPVRRKNTIEKLFFELSNHGIHDQKVTVKLIINGQKKSENNINIPSKSSITQQFSYINPMDTNSIAGLIQIEDHHLDFDNKLYFSYSTNNKIDIGLIYEYQPSAPLLNIFSDSIFNFQSLDINQINYENFETYNLVVIDQLKSITLELSQKLNNYIGNGGNVFMFVHEQANTKTYKKFLKSTNTDWLASWKKAQNNIKYINYENSLFKEVFIEKKLNINLPIVNGYFDRIKNTNSRERKILSFMNNEPFLSEYLYKKGRLFLTFSDLKKENNNFTEHALFIPCLYNASLAQNQKTKIYHNIYPETIIEFDKLRKNDILHLRKGIVFDMIPEIIISNEKQLVNFHNKIPFAENFEFINNNKRSLISFNYKRNESIMSFFHKKDLENIFPQKNKTFLKIEKNKLLKVEEKRKKDAGIKNFFIISAIILLIIELILLRLWKI